MLKEFPELETHVLFVGKTPAIITMAEEYFTKYDLTFDQYKNDEDALESFKTHVNRYTLVIIDASLEHGTDEVALTKSIRLLSRQKRQVPILVLSDSSDDERRTVLLNAGCNDFLPSPFRLQDLAARANILITNQHLLQKIDAQQQQLQSIRMTDQKTGLYSRVFLADQGTKLLSLAKRQKFPVSLIMVDIDDFKMVNDKYGFQTGDIVLQCMGVLINATCRSEDIATRFDAEEFVILLPYCDEAGAKEKAERLSTDIIKLKPDNIDITASFGIGSVPAGEPGDWESLLEAALQSLTQAQQNKSDNGASSSEFDGSDTYKLL